MVLSNVLKCLRSVLKNVVITAIATTAFSVVTLVAVTSARKDVSSEI